MGSSTVKDRLDGRGTAAAMDHNAGAWLSPTGDPAKISEMFGFAESDPIVINAVAVESSVPPVEPA